MKPQLDDRPCALRTRTLAVRVLTGGVVAAALAGQAAAFDMRACRLDALTFVDPWSKAEFPIERVGTDFYYACGDEEVISHDPTDAERCRGPYGDIMLEGALLQGDRELRFTAVYSVYKSTAPCCGWSVYDAGRPDIEKRVTWLAPGTAPPLQDWPFASIYNSWGDVSELDGFTAMICAPDQS